MKIIPHYTGEPPRGATNLNSCWGKQGILHVFMAGYNVGQTWHQAIILVGCTLDHTINTKNSLSSIILCISGSNFFLILVVSCKCILKYCILHNFLIIDLRCKYPRRKMYFQSYPLQAKFTLCHMALGNKLD